MAHFDVIVVGAGGMGTAAAAHLARRRAKVLVIDRFHLAHDRGSSHGNTRLIRKAYFESPDYVPLLHRAYESWDELGEAIGRPLLHRTGVLLTSMGGVDRRAEAERVAKLHGVTVEPLDTAALKREFPAFVHPEGSVGLFEPDAGYLEVEACVEAHAAVAARHGAEFAWGEQVLAIDAPAGTGATLASAPRRATASPTVTVRTSKTTHSADRVVVSAGPWTRSVLDDLAIDLVVHRVVQFWYHAEAPYRRADGLPCFAFDGPDAFVYGFPSLPGLGLKIAEHRAANPVDPDEYDTTLRAEDGMAVEAALRRHFRGLCGPPKAAKTCLYTMTPDEHFVVGVHPTRAGVIVAAGFSGHGFKFASVIGEILADLALEGSTRHAIGFLSPRR